MHILKRSIAVLSALTLCASASAHIIGITWNVLPGGDVKFDALHWHGNLSGVGAIGTAALTVNGTNYGFTSFTNDVDSMPGIAGLDNVLYSDWDGSSLTRTSFYNDWLHVVVPFSAFLPVGQTNTLNSTTGPGQLSVWTLTGGIQSIEFTLPPAPPTGVPDAGASGLMLGLGLALIGGFRRFSSRSAGA